MNDREFDPTNRTDRVRGRQWVPREGRNEFMQPTFWNSATAAIVIGVITVIGVALIYIFL